MNSLLLFTGFSLPPVSERQRCAPVGEPCCSLAVPAEGCGLGAAVGLAGPLQPCCWKFALHDQSE